LGAASLPIALHMPCSPTAELASRSLSHRPLSRHVALDIRARRWYASSMRKIADGFSSAFAHATWLHQVRRPGTHAVLSIVPPTRTLPIEGGGFG
jgi:hypothetical protein